MNQPKMNLDNADPRILLEALAGANRLRRFAVGIGGFLFGAICVLLPSPAEAQCSRWDASGEWQIKQGDLWVLVNLRQTGKTISGTAQYRARKMLNKHILGPDLIVDETRTGSVAGTVDGSKIMLDMDWSDGSGGIYRGVIGATGMIKGTVNIDKKDLGKTWPWNSVKPMTCVETKPEPKPSVGLGLPPPPKEPTLAEAWAAAKARASATPKRVIKSSGKARTETSAPAGVPRIAAFNKPGPAGTQVLTWDGGPDHPYAEVWVKVDGADETKVVEQGKGTREMTVEAGKTYQYILTDSGQQLATTNVKAK